MDQDTAEQTLSEQFKQKLAQKRKALDIEIEKFMAQKDAEFRRFERELKSQLRETASGEASETILHHSPLVARGFAVDEPFTAPMLKANSEAKVIQSGRDTTLTSEVNSPDTFSGQIVGNHSPVQDGQPPEQREVAVDALFASARLPQLQATHDAKSLRRALSNDDSSLVSTSLDTRGKHSDAERPSMAARRLSSSPTGTGRSSRKSSLKRPDSSDSARRKHVLFAIDNQVMSPSSSPVRTRSATSKPHSIPSPGLEGISSKSQTRHSTEQVDPLPNRYPPQTLSQSPSSFSRSYKDLIEPTAITPPEELQEEDLQSVIKDPLFGADESPPLINDGDWDLSPVEAESEEENGTFATSPHSGSIPIQIRLRQSRLNTLSR